MWLFNKEDREAKKDEEQTVTQREEQGDSYKVMPCLINTTSKDGENTSGI